MSKLSDKDSFYAIVGTYGAVGIQLAVSVVAGILIGDWLDTRWHTAPFLFLLGLLLGTAAGFVGLFRLISRSS